MTMVKSLVLMLGGALGTLSRYYLGIFFQSTLPLGFFPATLIINSLGCGLIGFFYGVGVQKGLVDQVGLLFFSVGFCGAFTTFSTFILESHELTQLSILHSLVYIIVSVVVGYFAFIIANAAVHLWIH